MKAAVNTVLQDQEVLARIMANLLYVDTNDGRDRRQKNDHTQLHKC